MLTIDGAQGEGGGQILRTSLALSALTGTEFEVVNVRANRAKPGLARQHVTAVQAAARVCDATVRGAEVGSRALCFQPRHVRPGHFTLDIGTAGSTSLVLQTILPPLMLAARPSTITLIGGTHNTKAPPYDFLEKAFLPLLARMGPQVGLSLSRPGFYPAGGGQVEARVTPADRLTALELTERGSVRERRARAWLSALPRHIGEREIQVARDALEIPATAAEIREVGQARGPGNAFMVEIETDALTEVFSAIGERGKPAETVAQEAVDEAQAWLAAGAPVGPHLADQLLLPLALAGGGSYRTSAPTLHTRTNVDVIRLFLDVPIRIAPLQGDIWEVRVG